MCWSSQADHQNPLHWQHVVDGYTRHKCVQCQTSCRIGRVADIHGWLRIDQAIEVDFSP